MSQDLLTDEEGLLIPWPTKNMTRDEIQTMLAELGYELDGHPERFRFSLTDGQVHETEGLKRIDGAGSSSGPLT